MQSLQQQIAAAQSRLYWNRNAGPTCGVLAITVALSTLVRPMSWEAFFLCALGGICFYLATLVADRWPGSSVLLIVLALALAVCGAILGGVIKGPLFWIQAIGTFFAFNLGAKVFHEGARETDQSEEP